MNVKETKILKKIKISMITTFELIILIIIPSTN